MIVQNNAVLRNNFEAGKSNSKNVPGVNVAGYLQAESGLGEAVRGNVRALEAANIPYVLNNCSFNLEYRNADNSFTNFSKNNPHPLNLIQINADSMFKFLEAFGTDYLKNRYNIGFWAWEMLRFPREWFFAFDLFDEIWTPSNFCVEAISAVSPVPVINMPHSIDLPVPSAGRSIFNLPAEPFVFLFIFDFCSTYERKNPAAVIKAFRQAFESENKNVLLVLKSSNAEFEPEKAAEMQTLANAAANIKFINKSLLREELNALIYNCDAYVSLHRSEGFGLTLAEAMFYGKPVIATDYSANKDFMNVGNSLPVKYRMTALEKDLGFFRQGDLWADADVEHAAQMMRAVFENRELAKTIGERAAVTVRDELSRHAIGEKIKNRLARISDLQNDFAQNSAEDLVQEKLRSSRIKLEYSEAENYQLHEKIKIMEASRFWKIRTQWFALKRKLRLTNKY